MTTATPGLVQFIESVPVLETFSSALPMKNYKTVPDEWFVAVTDVVKSREAIRQGRYKPVNMAGVSFISAVMNQLDHQGFPYIFGGDGAALCCSPAERDRVEEALAKTIAWVEDELDLELRGAVIPVAEIRKKGASVSVAGVRISEAVVNYAFSGGGITMAESLMKAGKFIVSRASGDDYPDLSGLSCRWTPVRQEGHRIVSLIVDPVDGKKSIPAKSLDGIFQLVRGESVEGHPVPQTGPGFTWPPVGLELEARATRGERSLRRMKTLLYMITLLAWILDRTGFKLGGFDPIRYKQFTALNTDYRKIQDGVRMTVSLSREKLAELKALLEEQRKAGNLRFGLCEQDFAVLTCFVPSITSDTHYHFLDGAGGGYAAAADELA